VRLPPRTKIPRTYEQFYSNQNESFELFSSNLNFVTCFALCCSVCFVPTRSCTGQYSVCVDHIPHDSRSAVSFSSLPELRREHQMFVHSLAEKPK